MKSRNRFNKNEEIQDLIYINIDDAKYKVNTCNFDNEFMKEIFNKKESYIIEDQDFITTSLIKVY